MRIIDRIALNRAIKILLDFILAVLKIFEKHLPDSPDGPVVPKPRNRPIKVIIDNIFPWRKK